MAEKKHSGFYDILDPLDEVMADKVFTIMEELLLRNCRLHMPSGKRGHEQLAKEQVLKTKTIANLRIFVEQAIRRLKSFCILKHELSISRLNKLDDVVRVVQYCRIYSIGTIREFRVAIMRETD